MFNIFKKENQLLLSALTRPGGNRPSVTLRALYQLCWLPGPVFAVEHEHAPVIWGHIYKHRPQGQPYPIHLASVGFSVWPG